MPDFEALIRRQQDHQSTASERLRRRLSGCTAGQRRRAVGAGDGLAAVLTDASRACRTAGWWHHQARPMKEISPLEMLGRIVARFAAVSGVIALLVWVTWVMLDIRNLQSGFTLP
jgi:hypothetical protein